MGYTCACSHLRWQRSFDVVASHSGVTAIIIIERHQSYLWWTSQTSTTVRMGRELASDMALVRFRQCVLYGCLASLEAAKVSKTAVEIGLRPHTCYVYHMWRTVERATPVICAECLLITLRTDSRTSSTGCPEYSERDVDITVGASGMWKCHDSSYARRQRRISDIDRLGRQLKVSEKAGETAIRSHTCYTYHVWGKVDGRHGMPV